MNINPKVKHYYKLKKNLQSGLVLCPVTRKRIQSAVTGGEKKWNFDFVSWLADRDDATKMYDNVCVDRSGFMCILKKQGP